MAVTSTGMNYPDAEKATDAELIEFFRQRRPVNPIYQQAIARGDAKKLRFWLEIQQKEEKLGRMVSVEEFKALVEKHGQQKE